MDTGSSNVILYDVEVGLPDGLTDTALNLRPDPSHGSSQQESVIGDYKE
jgi:hypothetical protein